MPASASRPAFSRMPCGIDRNAAQLEEHGIDILREAGFGETEIKTLQASRAFGGEPAS